jgi:protein KTI12
MALVTFSGYPCSGKTRRATQLKDNLECRLADPSYSGPLLKVVVLSDDTLNVDRSSYNGVVPIRVTSLLFPLTMP